MRRLSIEPMVPYGDRMPFYTGERWQIPFKILEKNDHSIAPDPNNGVSAVVCSSDPRLPLHDVVVASPSLDASNERVWTVTISSSQTATFASSGRIRVGTQNRLVLQIQFGTEPEDDETSLETLLAVQVGSIG